MSFVRYVGGPWNGKTQEVLSLSEYREVAIPDDPSPLQLSSRNFPSDHVSYYVAYYRLRERRHADGSHHSWEYFFYNEYEG